METAAAAVAGALAEPADKMDTTGSLEADPSHEQSPESGKDPRRLSSASPSHRPRDLHRQSSIAKMRPAVQVPVKVKPC